MRSPFILVKEGREHGQGVAYLDDGTMVVVERARDRIGDTIVRHGDERDPDRHRPHGVRGPPANEVSLA